MLLQSRVSEVLHVDIHPAAKMGRGVLMDHATGIVIGETAVVGDNVSLLHQVTLGGSGTGKGVRHPHIGDVPFWWFLWGNIRQWTIRCWTSWDMQVTRSRTFNPLCV